MLRRALDDGTAIEEMRRAVAGGWELRVRFGSRKTWRGLAVRSVLVCATAVMASGLGFLSHAHGTALSANHAPVLRKSTLPTFAHAGTTWHFAALPRPYQVVRLAVFNPHSTSVVVWIGDTRSSLGLQRALVSGVQTRVLRLNSAGNALSVRAHESIVPLRLATQGGGLITGFGLAGLGPSASNSVPLPARVWYFPALAPTDQADFLTVYNPNPYSIDVTVSARQATTTITGKRMRLAARSSLDVDLSFLHTVGAALTVTGSADLIPQQTIIGQQGERTSYGTPTS